MTSAPDQLHELHHQVGAGEGLAVARPAVVHRPAGAGEVASGDGLRKGRLASPRSDLPRVPLPLRRCPRRCPACACACACVTLAVLIALLPRSCSCAPDGRSGGIAGTTKTPVPLRDGSDPALPPSFPPRHRPAPVPDQPAQRARRGEHSSGYNHTPAAVTGSDPGPVYWCPERFPATFGEQLRSDFPPVAAPALTDPGSLGCGERRYWSPSTLWGTVYRPAPQDRKAPGTPGRVPPGAGGGKTPGGSGIQWAHDGQDR